MKRHSAQRLYTIIALLMILILMILWWVFTQWHLLVVYLCALNMTTLLFYAWDKTIAGGQVTRVPEVVLHGLALLGGSPMAIIGQKVFHHKTRKARFRLWQWAVVLLQICVLLSVFWLINS
jgi:uncharacterized membrane protein YsdA (DUF1294 family)